MAPCCICPPGLCFRAPPSGLRHALAAGYIPCYEALLRRTLRLGRDALGVDLQSFTLQRLPSLPLLLAYGDARQAASLAATLAKAVLVMAGEQGRGGGGGGSSGGNGSAGGGMGASASGSAAGGGGGGTSSGTGGNGGGLAAVRDGTVAVRAAALLRHLVHSLDNNVMLGLQGEGADGAAGTGEAGGSNAGAETEAEAKAEVKGGQGSSSGTVTRAASPRVASTVGRSQLLQLASFALQTLLPVCAHLLGCDEGGAAGARQSLLLPLVCQAVEVAVRGFETAVQRGDLVAAARWQRLLMDCGGPWLVVLQDEGGEPQEGVREGASEQPGQLSGRQLRDRLLRAAVPQLQHEAYPGGVAEGSCRQGGADGVGPPPPCVVGELLRTCCNPLCTNLEGDSEAGLEAGVGREEGLSGCYCSGACAVAHQVARRRQWGVARAGGAASSVGASERA